MDLQGEKKCVDDYASDLLKYCFAVNCLLPVILNKQQKLQITLFVPVVDLFAFIGWPTKSPGNVNKGP